MILLLVGLFLILLRRWRVLCVHVNQTIRVKSEEDRRLGLQLTPSLEIISIADDSLIARHASLSAGGGGIQVGDRIVGVNEVLFEEGKHRTIDHFTRVISGLQPPYTIQFESAHRKATQPQGSDQSSSATLSLSPYLTQLHVRLVNHIHSVTSAENDLNITAFMSEESFNTKQLETTPELPWSFSSFF